MERGCKIERGYILFDMLWAAIRMAGKAKRAGEKGRKRRKRKMTGTSFLTGKSLVYGESQKEGSECGASGR